jgi:phage-related protein
LPNHKYVIPFPLGWRFFDYLEGQNNPIEEWYQGLSEEAQDTFNALLKVNQKADSPDQWNGSKMLQGDCKEHGIWEWSFFADNRQQRLLGIFSSERKKAFFLIGCYHKQKRYTPQDCLKTAIKRAKELRKGTAIFHERKVNSNI